jgi:hypothetical protein
MKYSEQAKQLLTLGEPQELLPNYLTLGFTAAHADELIQMATDTELLNLDENDPLFWAAIHAWHVLGQLHVTKAVEPLLDLHEQYSFDELFYEEFPKVFALMGASAIPKLKEYLWNTKRTKIARSNVIPCLEELAKSHRQECLALFNKFLQQADEKNSSLAGLVICALIQLSAAESIEIIREAFKRRCVDISVPGDLEDVEIALGLRIKRVTPKPNYHNHSPEILQSLQALSHLTDLDGSELDYYSDSKVAKQGHKIGRNDPCPCGSGKKFKKCCLH